MAVRQGRIRRWMVLGGGLLLLALLVLGWRITRFTAPLPENRHRILTRVDWQLRGPVRAVTLYGISDGSTRRYPLERLQFDPAGRLVRLERFAGQTPLPQSYQTHAFRYDAQGRLLEETFDQDLHAIRDTYTPLPPAEFAYTYTPSWYWTAQMPPVDIRHQYHADGRLLRTTVIPQQRSVPGRHIQYRYAKTSPEVRDYTATDEQGQQRLTTSHLTVDQQKNWLTLTRAFTLEISTSPGQPPQRSRTVYRYCRTLKYFANGHSTPVPPTPAAARESFGLRGPVRTVEGPALLWRIPSERSVSSVPSLDTRVGAATERVAFNANGRVITTFRWPAGMRDTQLQMEGFTYNRQGALQTRTVHVSYPEHSDATTGMLSACVLGETLFPASESFPLSPTALRRVRRYDTHGRLVAETQQHDKRPPIRAECRYVGNNGEMRVWDAQGVLQHAARLTVTHDRYGNLLSRRIAWKVEDREPSLRVEEIGYLLWYDRGHAGSGTGYTHTQAVQVQPVAVPGLREARALTLAGPIPTQLHPMLLPMGKELVLWFTTGRRMGWLPLSNRTGRQQAQVLTPAMAPWGSVAGFAGCMAPASNDGRLVVEEDRSRFAGSAFAAWQLLVRPLHLDGEVPTLMPLPSVPAHSAPRRSSLHGHKHPSLAWLPAQRCYALASEYVEPSTRAVMMTFVTAQEQARGSVRTPFQGHTPCLANTQQGLALFFTQQQRTHRGTLWMATTPDGKRWNPARPLFPQLTAVEEITAVGDGRGRLDLVICDRQVFAAALPSYPATLYHATSRDNGRTWGPLRVLAKNVKAYTPSLACDARGVRWLCYAELGDLQQQSAVAGERPVLTRTSARLVIGRIE